MTNLSPEFCHRLREARRNAGLSQSVLAREVGCKQSALSMFEQGDGTKLNDDVVSKLAKKFKLELPRESAEERISFAERPAPVVQSGPRSAFCPNPFCPSHVSYEIDGRRFLEPNRARQDPVGGAYCAICGELLERRCPNCGAAVHEGAVCSFCGRPYVAIAGQ